MIICILLTRETRRSLMRWISVRSELPSPAAGSGPLVGVGYSLPLFHRLAASFDGLAVANVGDHDQIIGNRSWRPALARRPVSPVAPVGCGPPGGPHAGRR